MEPKTPDKASDHKASDVERAQVGYFIPVPTNEDESEIDLCELWDIVWTGRWAIISISLTFAILATIGSLLMPNVYRGDVLMASVAMEDESGSIASKLGGLGGLASLAGISLPNAGNTDENLAILTSREFLWRFFEEKNLLPILFEDDWNEGTQKWHEEDPDEQPSLWDAYRLFIEDQLLSVSTDRKTGLISVAVEWTDAALASQWANELVHRLNEYLRARAISRSTTNLEYLNKELSRSQVAEMRQTLFELIAKEQRAAMLANTQQEFAFRVLDPASEPDEKVKPYRVFIVLGATFLGGIFALFFVFIRDTSRSSDEERRQPENE